MLSGTCEKCSKRIIWSTGDPSDMTYFETDKIKCCFCQHVNTVDEYECEHDQDDDYESDYSETSYPEPK